MKKIVSIVVALILAFGCCAAFAEEYEPLTATAVVFGSPGFTPTTDNYGTHLIEDTFNIHLDVLPVDTATSESWNTFWIDGYADIIVPYGYGQILPLLNEELCRPIKVEWIQEYAPVIWDLLLQVYGDEETIMANLTYKGEVYCIPYFYDNTSISWITSIRKDWMENVGITELPTTMDELEALLDAFVNNDPDQNGEKDTYAISDTQYGLWNLPAYYGCSSALSFVKDNDGKVTTYATNDGYKAYLAKLAEWYAKGYIDPEYITDGRAEIRAKYAQGKLGIYSDNPWWFEAGRGEVGPLQMVCANYPDLSFSDGFAFFDNLPNEDDEKYVLSLYGNVQGQASIYFGYDCPDEVVIRMMQLSNARAMKYDGTEEDNERIKFHALMDMGPENEAWVWNPDTLNTDPAPGYEETVSGFAGNYNTEHGLYIFPTAHNTNYKIFEGASDEFVIDVYKMAQNTNKYWRQNNFVPPALEAALNDKLDLVSNCFSTFKTDIITGVKTIEADWDAYVDEMNSLGLQEILDAYSE